MGDIPYKAIGDVPEKMIIYNFEMIKNDCHFEMKSHRLIIERRFSPPAFRLFCVQYGQAVETQAVSHTKQSAEKKSHKD